MTQDWKQLTQSSRKELSPKQMSFNAAVTAFLNIKDGIASNQLDYFKFDLGIIGPYALA